MTPVPWYWNCQPHWNAVTSTRTAGVDEIAWTFSWVLTVK